MTLFDVGENRQFISGKVHYKSWLPMMVPANSHWMKLFTPKQLHRMIIKEHYDIEISYLEGPCARVISGCTDPDVKKFCWIHQEQKSSEIQFASFRSPSEAKSCYEKFDTIACVSKDVKESFDRNLDLNVQYEIIYNTNESDNIIKQSNEDLVDIKINSDKVNLVAVGKLLKNKGYNRLFKIFYKLNKEGYPVHLYVLGEGPERKNLESWIQEHELEREITLLGYQMNPYKYMSKCDLFICASYAEGFSTAATEALILGLPVCTVDVAGMKELLGEENEFGIVVPNTDEDLYKGIKDYLGSSELLSYYAKQAEKCSVKFHTSNTVHAVENLLMNDLDKPNYL